MALRLVGGSYELAGGQRHLAPPCHDLVPAQHACRLVGWTPGNPLAQLPVSIGKDWSSLHQLASSEPAPAPQLPQSLGPTPSLLPALEINSAAALVDWPLPPSPGLTCHPYPDESKTTLCLSA